MHSNSGQRLDPQTGLLYYVSRYYDPISGQFTHTDSVATNAGGLNTYEYVQSNPDSNSDSTGHAPIPPTEEYDPYLLYVGAWYSMVHPGSQTTIDGYNIPRARFPKKANVNANTIKNGNGSYGTPDIVNTSQNSEGKTTNTVWEVKSNNLDVSTRGTD